MSDERYDSFDVDSDELFLARWDYYSKYTSDTSHFLLAEDDYRRLACKSSAQIPYGRTPRRMSRAELREMCDAFRVMMVTKKLTA